MLETGMGPDEEEISIHQFLGCKTVTTVPKMSCSAACELYKQPVVETRHSVKDVICNTM